MCGETKQSSIFLSHFHKWLCFSGVSLKWPETLALNSAFLHDYSSQWDRSLFKLSAVEFKESLHFPWLNEWEGKGPVYRASPCLPAPLLFWWWAYSSPKENAVWAVCIVRFDVTDINISPSSAFTTEPYGGNSS